MKDMYENQPMLHHAPDKAPTRLHVFAWIPLVFSILLIGPWWFFIFLAEIGMVTVGVAIVTTLIFGITYSIFLARRRAVSMSTLNERSN